MSGRRNQPNDKPEILKWIPNAKERTLTLVVSIPREETLALTTNGNAKVIHSNAARFVQIPETAFFYKLTLLQNLGSPQFADDIKEFLEQDTPIGEEYGSGTEPEGN